MNLAEVKAVAPLPAGGFPVLLVENNRLLRRVTHDLIVAAGYRVLTASGAQEALAILEREPIQIVITDANIPDMDGVELCRRIRGRVAAQYTYLILITGRGSHEEMIAGLEAGADEYLVKPLTAAEVSARLKIARRILDLEWNLRKSLAEISRLSLRDPLTEMFNRRFMIERLPQEIKRAYRYQRPLSLVMLDLDHFKRINDDFGHPAGDRVLCSCAQSLGGAVRDDLDWVVRYGGEEFVIVLPETDHVGAMTVAERMRERVAAHIIPAAAGGVHVTASLGVATLSGFTRGRRCSVEILLEAADRCLYQAKGEGRNRVRGMEI